MARHWDWGAQGDNNTSMHALDGRGHAARVHRPQHRHHRGGDRQAAEGLARHVSRRELRRPRTCWPRPASNTSPTTRTMSCRWQCASSAAALFTMPYTLELNDVPTILGKGASAEVFGQMIRNQFDVLYEEAGELPQGHVDFAASVHRRTSVPHEAHRGGTGLRRIAQRCLADHGVEINDWYRANYMIADARKPGRRELPTVRTIAI